MPADWREQASQSAPTTLLQRIGAAVKQTSDQYGKLMRGIPELLDVVGGLLRQSGTGGAPSGKQKQNFALGPKTRSTCRSPANAGFAAPAAGPASSVLPQPTM